MDTNNKSNNIQWDYVAIAISFVAVFGFIAFFLYMNQTGENTEVKAKLELRQALEVNETVRMLVEVAYENDTTQFNEYQKGILKAVINRDINGALKAMAPHHKKVTLKEAGNAV